MSDKTYGNKNFSIFSSSMAGMDSSGNIQYIKETDNNDGLLSGFGSDWGFDILQFFEQKSTSVLAAGKFLFHKWHILDTFDINESVLNNFLYHLEISYKGNPYHNACHAADVAHSFFYMVSNSIVHKYMTMLDWLSSVISTLAHDVGHPGLTNRYLVNSRDPLTMIYNDNSVLENMHCAKVYEIMGLPNSNILAHMLPSDWQKIRK